MAELNDQEKQDYSNRQGGYCPYCDADYEDIETGELEPDRGKVQQMMSCSVCKKKWYDVYFLVHVEEIED